MKFIVSCNVPFLTVPYKKEEPSRECAIYTARELLAFGYRSVTITQEPQDMEDERKLVKP